MPSIYARWMLRIGLRFANNPSKCAHLRILSGQHWTFPQIYMKNHSIGEQIFLEGMEFLNNAHHIREMKFGDLPQIGK